MAGKSITYRGSSNNKTPAKILKSNPAGKLDMGTQWTFEAHRSGWPVVLDKLATLHNPNGVLFDGFVDQTFAWYREEAIDNGEIPYVTPWVGFLHNPPNVPGFYERMASPEVFLNSYYMRESLPYCKGLIVLSDYLKKWLEPKVDCPVLSIPHPTQTPEIKFSWSHFKSNPNKKIIQLGFWLRKLHSLKHLNAPNYCKVWLISHEHAMRAREMEKNSIDIYDSRGFEVRGRYEEWDRVSDNEYDYLLSQNISFLDLYDSSANNAVIECIVRNTPLLVCKHPAIVEYLGADYPFYFENLDEAGRKAQDEALIHDTSEYLKNMDKQHLDPGNFIATLTDSKLYKDISLVSDSHPYLPKSPNIDSLKDLNIVRGKPLEADYIFVVAFRNQEMKILRCLESVIPQCQNYSSAIILIDDNSSDQGLDRAMELLDQHGMDFVAVQNLDRKYFTRNLYNAVNLLVLRDDSVILEIDGDDYLEDTEVLKFIHNEYVQGARKTFGSFRMSPESGDFPQLEQLRNPDLVSVVSDPWNLDFCVPWLPLRTYRKELFMQVPLPYFWEKSIGGWLKTGEDYACHALMTAIAGDTAHYIDRVLYVYDNSGIHHDQNLIDRPRYIVENLYRLPTGKLLGEYWEQSRLSGSERSVSDSIGPRIGIPGLSEAERVNR